jgi:hypothetical protein
MHGLILISNTEYKTLSLFEGLDPTSNRLIHFFAGKLMEIDEC